MRTPERINSAVPDSCGWEAILKLLFWAAAVLIAYAYIGYAILLWLLAKLRFRPVLQGAVSAKVSILIAVRNEEANLQRKIANLLTLNYPRERLEIIIVSDGSTDSTSEVLRAHSREIVPVISEQQDGKATALNEAVKYATGEILMFQDARQAIDPDAVNQLIACFADPEVGAASGELQLEAESGAPSIEGLGIYWKIEKVIRKLESASGSVVGVTGALYAIRRELYMEMPPGTILDDVFIPMHAARKGKRVIFQPKAIARDRLFAAKGKEFSRKVRTLTGNYQLLRLAPWLLTAKNPILFRFVSHKLMRLSVPFLLMVMLVTSAVVPGTFFLTMFWLQIGFYFLALVGSLIPDSRRFKLIAIANTFVMLNVAAALAFYNFIAGRNRVWV